MDLNLEIVRRVAKGAVSNVFIGVTKSTTRSALVQILANSHDWITVEYDPVTESEIDLNLAIKLTSPKLYPPIAQTFAWDQVRIEHSVQTELEAYRALSEVWDAVVPRFWGGGLGADWKGDPVWVVLLDLVEEEVGVDLWTGEQRLVVLLSLLTFLVLLLPVVHTGEKLALLHPIGSKLHRTASIKSPPSILCLTGANWTIGPLGKRSYPIIIISTPSASCKTTSTRDTGV